MIRAQCVLSVVCLLGVLGRSPTAQALPDDVARIFDKSQRQLSSPPPSLRSDETSADSRYFSGVSRLKRRVSSEDPVETKAAPEAAESRVVVVREEAGGNRAERRQQRLGTYGFNGRRVFGVGFVGAGSYGIFGAEADFSFGNDWSGGIGIGTGMAYSSWGFHARHYFQKGNLTPYAQFGYANWTLHRNPYRETEIYPVYLGEQFLQNKDGSFKVRERVHLLYPALGVLFQSESGLAFTMQLQYLISALDFKGALAGGFGLHFYF